MTAEVADGWLPLFYMPEKAKDVWGDALAKGAAKRAADLGPLEVVRRRPVAIGDDVEVDPRLRPPDGRPLRRRHGRQGRNFYNDLVCRYGFEKEAEQIQDLYLDGKKDEAAAAVPDELLEADHAVGPEGYVKERIAAFKEAGVTMLNITPIGPDPAEIVEPGQGVGWP